jgi:hypothetical protein
MKSYLTPLLFSVASLVAISANAGAPSYFIPSEPTVTAPADQASNVAITPELTSSDFLFTESYESGNPPTLSTSNWVISKKSDNILILGSESASREENGRVRSLSEFSFEYDIPFAITLSDQTATKLQVSTEDGYQSVKLLSSVGNVIAYADIGLNEFNFQSERNFIISTASSNSLSLQWHLTNSVSTEAIIEFILIDSGLNGDQTAKNDIFGWRITPNEYTNSIFNSENSGAGCEVAIDGNDSTAPSDYSTVSMDLPGWRDADSGNYDEFYLACTSKPADEAEKHSIHLLEISPVDVTSFLPKINVFSSPSESYTLNDGEALNLSTEYTAQVQHIGGSGELTGGSSWSAPVSFTTRAADTNYQVTTPTDLAFTVGVAKNLAFKVSNTGTEAGSPKLTIRLPFNALEVLNGSLHDFFQIISNEPNCSMSAMAEKTDFTCEYDSLAAGGEVQLTTKITVEDIAVESIEYQVCDLDKCDDTPFTTVNISVTDAEPAAQSPAASSSSSSGGSMFWLLLMAPLLLVRRK